MYLKIKKAELVPDARGKHIKITMVWLYHDDGKRATWVSLTPEILEAITGAVIPFVVPEAESKTEERKQDLLLR